MPYKPDGYTSLAPYLIVDDAEAALAFIKAVLGVDPIYVHRTDDGRLAHLEIRVDDTVLMLGEMAGATSTAHLHLYVPDVDVTFSRARAAGAPLCRSRRARAMSTAAAASPTPPGPRGGWPPSRSRAPPDRVSMEPPSPRRIVARRHGRFPVRSALKLFACPDCGHTLYFENALCEACGAVVGYDASSGSFVVIIHGGENPQPSADFQFCANAAHDACNWAVPLTLGDGALCRACIHNETIPDLSVPENVTNWQVIERAKKRLFYQLILWNLPLKTRVEDPEHGLAFNFLADAAEPVPVMTGHENGIITIALAEADDAERERRRNQMGEPYRTLLGHFRHEIAHHYWDLLVGNGGPDHERFKAIFGDETQDYGDALQNHYAFGAPEGWPQSFVSAYATAHPWEDFAETWAHYLHIVDTLETACAFGMVIDPPHVAEKALRGRYVGDPYSDPDTDKLARLWVPLTIALNSLNRSMGRKDAYPFVLTPAITEKLDFIAHLIQHQR